MIKLTNILKEIISESKKDSFILYHGTESDIEKFSDEFVGAQEANDAEGPGIYMTTSRKYSMAWGHNIYKVEVSGNFVSRNAPKSVVDKNELIKLIKMQNDWEMDAQDWDQDPEMGVNKAVESAIQYNDDEGEIFQQIWYDFYRYIPKEYVRNMTKLGYDGLVLDAPPDYVGEKTVLIYNPEIIKFISKERWDD